MADGNSRVTATQHHNGCGLLTTPSLHHPVACHNQFELGLFKLRDDRRIDLETDWTAVHKPPGNLKPLFSVVPFFFVHKVNQGGNVDKPLYHGEQSV